MRIFFVLCAVLACWTLPARAVTFSAEDLSNQAITCRPGSLGAGLGCPGYGPGALQVTINTVPGEFPLLCELGNCSPGYDIYVAILYQQQWYTMSNWCFLMQPLPADVSSVKPTFAWQVPLNEFLEHTPPQYTVAVTIQPLWQQSDGRYRELPLDGMEIYVGVVHAGDHHFAPSTFHKVWPQRNDAVHSGPNR